MTRTDAVPELIARGHAAAEARDWNTALDAFRRAVELQPGGEPYEGLAIASWWLNDFDASIAAREQAYRLYREAGDARAAARAAVWLASDYADLRGQPAVGNGWLQRAYRVLGEDRDCVEYGWARAYEAHAAMMQRHEAESAHACAAEAITLGRTHADTDLEATATAYDGLARIMLGEVDAGITMLDEAATVALSGEMREDAWVGTILCYLMDACDRIRDYDRAAQWCDRVRAWAERYMPEIYAICRPHYAVVLMWRGEWMRAESELETAMSDLATYAAPMITESIVRLAELRTQQGRFDEAVALFRRVEGDALAQAPRAELALALGQYDDAASLAERHLRRLPAADRIDRATGLELAVRAYAALGRFDDARAALAELDEVAAIARADPVRAAASFASGVLAVAEARLGDAVRSFEDAVDEYAASGAPFQTGRARVALADALHRLGRTDAAVREAEAARDALAALGAAHEAGRAEKLLAAIKRGGPPAPAGPSTHELTDREVDVLRLIAEGRSNQQIAEALVLSPRTVERHISNIYLKIGVSGAAARAAAAAYALRHGIVPPS